jgi:hypothetical protein
VVRPPYRVVLRLYAIAAQRWAEIDGQDPSFDPIKLPVDRFCNLIYKWSLDHIKPEDLEEWKMLLNAPAPWEPGSTEGPQMWGDEDEAATWDQAMSSLGKG